MLPAKFTIGAARAESKGDYAMKRGTVMEAKKKLEDKIRKEKREKKIEEVRKPLLATPTRKRERSDESDWQHSKEPEDVRKTVTGTPMTPKMLTQTAIGSFLVHQTVEERRKIFKSSCKENKVPDMSASPALKSRKRTKSGRKVMPRRCQGRSPFLQRILRRSTLSSRPCLSQNSIETQTTTPPCSAR